MDTSFQPKPYYWHGYGPDRNYNSTEPREVLEAIFKRTKGTPPARGNSRMSREEGLILSLAQLATQAGGQGTQCFDATLSDSSAAGMLAAQVYRNIAHKCIVQGARSVQTAMWSHDSKATHI